MSQRAAAITKTSEAVPAAFDQRQWGEQPRRPPCSPLSTQPVMASYGLQRTTQEPLKDPMLPPRTLPDPQGSPQACPEIRNVDHATFVENRVKNSQAARSHQPASNSQQHNQAVNRRLFLQPSVDANANARTTGVSLCTQLVMAECAERLKKQQKHSPDDMRCP